MKIAFAGKGGVGKTTLCAWLGDHLARRGEDVWLVDADTALSLGQACGLARAELPVPLSRREDLVRERIGGGMLRLTPEVDDLPEALGVDLPLGGPVFAEKPGRKRLLVMGGPSAGGEGCACTANALLKALLAHLVLERRAWVLVDLEAGVEHLGRGTVADVDGLVVVSEPSWRGLETAAEVSRMARELGLSNQVLALNRFPEGAALPEMGVLPGKAVTLPALSGLAARQLRSPSVLGLPEDGQVVGFCAELLELLAPEGSASRWCAERPLR